MSVTYTDSLTGENLAAEDAVVVQYVASVILHPTGQRIEKASMPMVIRRTHRNMRDSPVLRKVVGRLEHAMEALDKALESLWDE